MLKKKKMFFGISGLFYISLVLACGPGGSISSEPLSSQKAPFAEVPVETERSAPQDTSPITIAAVGDIMMGTTIPDESRMPPKDGADMLKEVTPILSAADITFGNLEGPLSDTGNSAKCATLTKPPKIDPTAIVSAPPVTETPSTDPSSAKKPAKKAGGCFAFRVPTRFGKHLKDAGFDVMSLANNHAGDIGDIGRINTRKTLDALGIKHAGSDRGQYAMTIVEAKGKKIAFIGFAHNNIVPNVNDLGFARQLVEQANKKADIVVVSFHGGAEGATATRVPNGPEIFVGEQRGNLRAFARTVIDAGADLVLGHGPHVLRGMEIYKDRLVAYSLGNFATYGRFGLSGPTAETMILETQLDSTGKFLSGKIHAGMQYGLGGPSLDKSGRAIRTIRNLSALDFAATAPKIGDDGTISAK